MVDPASDHAVPIADQAVHPYPQVHMDRKDQQAGFGPSSDACTKFGREPTAGRAGRKLQMPFGKGSQGDEIGPKEPISFENAKIGDEEEQPAWATSSKIRMPCCHWTAPFRKTSRKPRHGSLGIATPPPRERCFGRMRFGNRYGIPTNTLEEVGQQFSSVTRERLSVKIEAKRHCASSKHAKPVAQATVVPSISKAVHSQTI